MKRIYLDYAATTPLDPRVRRAMEPYFSVQFGNPGSIHRFGQEAMAGVDQARETIAKAIGGDFREIVFTGSATEANNLALRGVVKGFRVQGIGARVRRKKNTLNPSAYTLYPRIVISAIEHESVLETARDLEREGAEVVVLPVSREGIVDLAALRASLNERTVLVSVMYANNEIGTVQPIAEIAKIIQGFRVQGIGSRVRREKNTLYPSAYTLYPLFHTDAVQAFQYLNCNVDVLGVDLMTFSSHKIYGPKGAGALYVRQETRDKRQGLERQETRDKEQRSVSMSHVPCPMSPIITGGGQEFGLRSGTENVPAIVGFAKAVELAVGFRAHEAKRVTKLRDQLFSEIARHIPEAVLNGSRAERVPNNIHLRVPGVLAEKLLMAFDLRGIAVSAGPACAARTAQPSHVLSAIGLGEQGARECIRITLGRQTRQADVDYFLKAFVQYIHHKL